MRGSANEFQLQWIHDAILATLLQVAERERTTLKDALTQLGPAFNQSLLETLEALLECPSRFPQSDSGDPAEQDEPPSRVHQRLADLLANSIFADRVQRIVSLLWAEPTEEWVERARARFLSTVGNGALAAFLSLCPEFPDDELVLDLDFQVAPDFQASQR